MKGCRSRFWNSSRRLSEACLAPATECPWRFRDRLLHSESVSFDRCIVRIHSLAVGSWISKRFDGFVNYPSNAHHASGYEQEPEPQWQMSPFGHFPRSASDQQSVRFVVAREGSHFSMRGCLPSEEMDRRLLKGIRLWSLSSPEMRSFTVGVPLLFSLCENKGVVLSSFLSPWARQRPE